MTLVKKQSTKLNFQLGVSEDLGTNGIKVMDFPPHVGWCRAGKQLFAIIPASEHTIYEVNKTTKNKIGTIVGFVNVFEPELGHIYKVKDKLTNDISYEISFDHDAINQLQEKRLNGTYKDGCFAREVMDEKN